MKTLILSSFVLLAGCVTSSQPRTSSASPLSDSSSSDAFTDEAFNGVKAAFEKTGARVERDMTTPGGRTVRIYLSLGVALEMTALQAKTLATSAKARLSEKAVVYIYGPDGNRLGKTSAFD